MADETPPIDDLGVRATRRAETARLALALLAGALLRSLHPGQPIVENYVGRQTPTAMVARNLERGSGFFRPQLDTGPFPNYFLVEPPIYQELVVGLRRATGLPLDACGRLTSAAAATLAAWGVYVLVRRRSGEGAALAAAAAFSMLPVTIRYGRAFQPDALMIGACTAGLALWDRAASRGGGRLLAASGWALLAVGLAAKATAAYLVVVAMIAIFPRKSWRAWLLCVSTLLPVLAWYAWADRLAGSGEGSRAAAENRAIWLGLLGLGALGSAETWRNVARFLAIRAFTPLGLLGATWGLASLAARRRGEAALWGAWAGLALAAMAVVAGKLHHEYYWLCLAPPVAAGLGSAWARIDARRPLLALASAMTFAALCMTLSNSTWQTPDEWEMIEAAGKAVAEATGRDALVVAPEALLHSADRRGCRLEYTWLAATRAASEWDGGRLHGLTPIELVDFYRARGARWFADVGAEAGDEARLDLHREIRHRYKVVIDRPEVLLAELAPGEPAGHAD